MLAYGRPKDGVATLAYGRPKDGVATLAYAILSISRSGIIVRRLTPIWRPRVPETWRWRVPEFTGEPQRGEAVSTGTDTTRATAYLPGLEIEITHRCAAEGDAEHISINLKAMPSLEAFARAFEAANPFAFWMRSIELAWQPWIEATRAMALPWAPSPSLTPPDADAGAARNDNSPG